MRIQTDVDGGKYCDLMEEIKRRIEVITYFLSGGGHALYQPTTLESACLQIRKILELVAFGSLVANREVYTTVYTKISKAWNASDILQELKKVNPNFYPVPVIELPSGIPGVATRHQKRVGDYLDEEEFEEVYGRCGVMAHAANPYREGIDYGYYAKMLPKWRTRIMHLLNSHNIQLVGNPGIYLVHMSEHGDDRVKFYRFQPPTDEALQKLGLRAVRDEAGRVKLSDK
jgi:hypothetical protein